MKVKDLIAKLKSMPQEATVVSQEYTGCNHTIHEITQIIEHKESDIIKNWDNSTNTSSVDKSGKCTRSVVYIN